MPRIEHCGTVEAEENARGAVGPTLFADTKINGIVVCVMVAALAQSTIVPREILHNISHHQHQKGQSLPVLKKLRFICMGRISRREVRSLTSLSRWR